MHVKEIESLAFCEPVREFVVPEVRIIFDVVDTSLVAKVREVELDALALAMVRDEEDGQGSKSDMYRNRKIEVSLDSRKMQLLQIASHNAFLEESLPRKKATSTETTSWLHHYHLGGRDQSKALQVAVKHSDHDEAQTIELDHPISPSWSAFIQVCHAILGIDSEGRMCDYNFPENIGPLLNVLQSYQHSLKGENDNHESLIEFIDSGWLGLFGSTKGSPFKSIVEEVLTRSTDKTLSKFFVKLTERLDSLVEVEVEVEVTKSKVLVGGEASGSAIHFIVQNISWISELLVDFHKHVPNRAVLFAKLMPHSSRFGRLIELLKPGKAELDQTLMIVASQLRGELSEAQREAGVRYLIAAGASLSTAHHHMLQVSKTKTDALFGSFLNTLVQLSGDGDEEYRSVIDLFRDKYGIKPASDFAMEVASDHESPCRDAAIDWLANNGGAV